MDVSVIEKIIKRFQWCTLERMYGSAHSSITGFIATDWINQSNENSILDGAPSPTIGNGRDKQNNADLLLCKRDKPLIVVEVESGVSKYEQKINSILKYLSNRKDFDGLEFGLLIMSNIYNGSNYGKYKHNWTPIKNKVKESKENIVLVSIEKSKAKLGDSPLDRLRRRNDYYPWDIVNIDYWIHTTSQNIEGNLWKKKR